MKLYFAKLPKKICGFYVPSTDVMVIDLNKDENPCRTYVHELIHKTFPYLPEVMVETIESYVWDSLTERQKYALFKSLFSHPFRRWRNDA